MQNNSLFLSREGYANNILDYVFYHLNVYEHFQVVHVNSRKIVETGRKVLKCFGNLPS